MEELLENCRKMVNIDKKVKGLREGLYRFFDNKFTANGFNINATVGEGGYHMTYRDVEYSMDFVYRENVEFNMHVVLPKKDKKLEARLDEGRVSNRQLDLTKYLSDQRISTNGSSAYLSCRLKKVPEGGLEINKFTEQLWGSIIKRVMKAVYD